MQATDFQSRNLPETDLESIDEFETRAPAMVRTLLTELIRKRTIASAYHALSLKAVAVCHFVELTDDTLEIELQEDKHFNYDPNVDAQYVIVGFLDHIKVQFQVDARELVRGDGAVSLRCAIPERAYRIQRRGAFRVRPMLGRPPELVVRGEPGIEISYQILDLSATGLAFELSEDSARVGPGELFEHARLELGPRVPIPCTVLIRSISTVNDPDGDGQIVRVGGEFVNLPGEIAREIQTYVQDAERASVRMAK